MLNKPSTLKDLMIGGYLSKGDVKKIARAMFNGKTTGAGPEGYLMTASKFDDLPDGTQQHIVKAILEFTVENVLDADNPYNADPLADLALSEASVADGGAALDAEEADDVTGRRLVD